MNFLETSFGHLAYKKYGSGKNMHLLFHGFGQNMRVFESFLPILQKEDCFITIDIFYHGQSSWNSINQKLTKEIWKEIILQLMKQEDFEKFHLVGFSMGGKFCLITFELFPCLVQSLLLIAPDGVKTGFWYNMATFPGILNKFFKRVVFHPNGFFRIMSFLENLGLLDKSLIKFVHSQMKTRTKRAQIYFTWNVFKPLKPDLKKITEWINGNQTPISLFTGKYDNMVTSKNLKSFSSKILHIQALELSCGHNSLIEETLLHLKRTEIPQHKQQT